MDAHARQKLALSTMDNWELTITLCYLSYKYNLLKGKIGPGY